MSRATEAWKLLVRPGDTVPQCQLLLVLRIELPLFDAALVLEETLCEGVVLSLDSVVFSLADGDVQRARADAVGGPLRLVLGWPVDGAVLALRDVHELVQQNLVVPVEQDVFLFGIKRRLGISKSETYHSD